MCTKGLKSVCSPLKFIPYFFLFLVVECSPSNTYSIKPVIILPIKLTQQRMYVERYHNLEFVVAVQKVART